LLLFFLADAPASVHEVGGDFKPGSRRVRCLLKNAAKINFGPPINADQRR